MVQEDGKQAVCGLPDKVQWWFRVEPLTQELTSLAGTYVRTCQGIVCGM